MAMPDQLTRFCLHPSTFSRFPLAMSAFSSSGPLRPAHGVGTYRTLGHDVTEMLPCNGDLQKVHNVAAS